MLEQAKLKDLAVTRLQAATCLLEAGLPSGTFYLAGLAIELAIKACIAEQFQARTIPDKKFVDSIYNHDLEKLIKIAGLEPDLNTAKDAHQAFAENWEMIQRWKIDCRYRSIEIEDARDYLEATSNSHHGVFTWIQAHW